MVRHHKGVQRILAAWLVISVASAICYRSLGEADYVWDDDNYVTQNHQLRSLTGLWKIWTAPEATPQYYPLIHSSFWIEFQLWKLHPVGYHATNVVLHILNALLFASILRKLNVPGSSFAALLFAIHPVHVESVAWITERKNVLSLFFYLLSARSFFSLSGETRPMAYFGVLLLFACALLSKTVTATLPAALLVISIWRGLTLGRAEVKVLISMVLVAIPFAALTVSLEKHHVGASGDLWNFSWQERLLIAGRSIWFHLGKLVWPSNLIFVYPRFILDTSSWTWSIAPGSVLVTIALLVGLRHKKEGAAALVAFCLYCGTLFPALGFFNIYPMQYTFVADHYQYHASLSVIALLSAALARFTRVIGHYDVVTRRGLQITIAIAMMTITSNSALRFRNSETLWQSTLDTNPNAVIAHVNLGEVFRKQGRLYAAAQQYIIATQIAPDDPLPATNHATTLFALGQQKEAKTALTNIVAQHPEHGNAHYNLGLIHVEAGNAADAMACFSEALQCNPDHAPAQNAIGMLHFQAGEFRESVVRFKKAHQTAPFDAEFLTNLGAALLEAGDSKKAITSFREALKLQPSLKQARGNLSRALSLTGRCAEAITIANGILKENPNDPTAIEVVNRCGEPSI